MWRMAERTFQTSTRLLLFLTCLHTLPVVWLTPVSAGTAPTAALLSAGVAGLFSFDREGFALGLIALGPALIYVGLAWILAWLLERFLRRLGRVARLVTLGAVVLALLTAVYFPIYIVGGHNSSSSANLIGLLAGVPRPDLLIAYWVGLHLLLAGLYGVQFLRPEHPSFSLVALWGGQVLRLLAVVSVAGLVYVNSTDVICRPLAHLGVDAAQLCLARAGGVEARSWYERAGAEGNQEALVWLVANTPDRRQRLDWLRKGAAAGVPELQFELAGYLRRYGGAVDEGEATRWMEAAVQAGYAPALMVRVEALTAEVLRTGSAERLEERNALLEAAARDALPEARRRLGEHYLRGSFGYPADLDRAGDYYLALCADPAGQERMRVVANAGSDESRLAQIERWRAGLATNDPNVQLELGRLYLASPLPGPDVRARGIALLERAAAQDPAARMEVIRTLRSGSHGVDRDLETARRLLLQAAADGEADAMALVAEGYLNGRDGFPRDLPEARVWIGRLIAHEERLGGAPAQRRIASLASELAYIDRLEEMAGGELLGASDLDALSVRNDAESLYRFGLQLLAVGEPADRREGVARLQAAADLGHAGAAWRLVEIYERGFAVELDPEAARRELLRAASLHHFEAIRELASRYEYGKKGFEQDLPRAIRMYQDALAAGRDNRYGWELSDDNFNHFPWLESRLKQARLKQARLTQTGQSG
jgi:TPR repeat protein